MALETGTYVDDLVATNPASSDDRSTADDHLRLIKSLLLATFPNAGVESMVNYSVNGGGTGSAYTLTLTPAPTAYTAGMTIRFKANATNTGAVTVNVNSLGAKNLYGPNGALPAGAVGTGSYVEAVYDGTQFKITGGSNPEHFISSATIGTASITTATITTASITSAVITSASVTSATVTSASVGTVTIGRATITSTATLDASVVFGAQVYFDGLPDNGSSGSADTIDWTIGNKQRSTLTADCTYTFTAPTGPCSLTLIMIQDGTGGWAPTWPAAVKWENGSEPSWDESIGAINIATFLYDGTYYYGAGGVGFA